MTARQTYKIVIKSIHCDFYFTKLWTAKGIKQMKLSAWCNYYYVSLSPVAGIPVFIEAREG